MLSVKQLDGFGGLRGAIYDFECCGDMLPSHVHDETTHHITIVARGRLQAYADGWCVEAAAGQILDFKAGQPHELKALEDGTRVINIVKPA